MRTWVSAFDYRDSLTPASNLRCDLLKQRTHSSSQFYPLHRVRVNYRDFGKVITLSMCELVDNIQVYHIEYGSYLLSLHWSITSHVTYLESPRRVCIGGRHTT